MTTGTLLGVIAAVAPLIVAVLEAVMGRRARKRDAHEKLARHSTSELHAATDGVQPIQE